ncbi:putative phospholipid metabolism enzyme regulator [Golovinomyces cichoracearum]|uniref:Putative phospholipid metabolism enzyme regulator n=1 Tax=Golovinomyces cichoracearum TaxID=62708 RepID=A0A420IHY6_9PEZI|nr:putative phospholipid metabolism enzyme regulator [Golovinomyces cichoracearum]
MDKSSQPIPGPKQETATPVDSSHEKSSYIPSSRAVDRLLPREPASATSSTNPSRDSSPSRLLKSQIKAAYITRSSGPAPSAASTRSRKNNTQEISSLRSTNPPSAAAAQRALSASSIPILQSAPSDSNSKLPVQRSLVANEVKDIPYWAIPRLRSPPPSNDSATLSPRKLDVEPVPTPLRKSSKIADEAEELSVDSESEEIPLFSGMRTPARGVSGASSTLETVQEISQPGTPTHGADRIIEKFEITMAKSATYQEDEDEYGSPKTITLKPSISANESGNESAGKKEAKLKSIRASLPSVNRPSGIPCKSFISAGIGRGKASGEGSSQNMTVETETVSSISQIAVGPGGLGNIGHIRAKPSSETIRPKKEKKKAVRKPPSLNAGAASSKADIFEAKVACAVDEANSSDSEETFVYESNPPESNERPRLFHSRTPSTTSTVSQVDPRNLSRAVLDGHQSIVMKKSMKFANSFSSTGPDSMTGDDIGKGTVRSNVGTFRCTAQHHRVNSRWGRHAGNSHTSLFDNESTFLNATTSKLLESSSRTLSRPTSPRSNSKMIVNTRKSPPPSLSEYGLDHTSNERTSLLRSKRPLKSTQSRRRNESIAQLEHQTGRTILSRRRGCLALCFMLLVVISGVAGFIYATTQALSDLQILSLTKIYATKNFLVFDMKVKARNPNLVAITIESSDLAFIAKTRFSEPDVKYPKGSRSMRQSRRGIKTRENDIDMPSVVEDQETTLDLKLGRVFTLDSPLTFEGSLFRSIPTTSVCQISILDPGIDPISTKCERWKRILKHEFNLIVRGRLNYNLPFNQEMKGINVEFQDSVTPKAGEISPNDTSHIIW